MSADAVHELPTAHVSPGIKAPAEASEVEGLPSDIPVALIRKNSYQSFDVRLRRYSDVTQVLIRVMKWNGTFSRPCPTAAGAGAFCRLI